MIKPKVPRAILFDLDDTILSDDTVSEEAWREPCEIVVTYHDLKAKLVRLLPNAEQTLNQLRSRGIKMALLTNGEAESQRAKVEKLGLRDYFPVCLIEGELGFG